MEDDHGAGMSDPPVRTSVERHRSGHAAALECKVLRSAEAGACSVLSASPTPNPCILECGRELQHVLRDEIDGKADSFTSSCHV